MTDELERMVNLAIHSAAPTGTVTFYVVLVDEHKTPLAHGPTAASGWTFIDGRPAVILKGYFRAIASGCPAEVCTFVTGDNNSARWLTDGPIEMDPVSTGDAVDLTNTLSMPVQPLPDWVLA